MKKIAFHVEKGGVGKTTTCGNAAVEISQYGKTLLVDCDPQGNLTSWFITAPMRYDMADVLQEKAALTDAIMPVSGGLDLLPTFAIDGELKDWAESKLMTQPYAFPNLMDAIEAAGYQFVLFDLGPGISLLEKSILANMDEVVGIAKAEYFSFDGIEIFLHEIGKLRKHFRARFSANKLVVNMVNESFKVHRAYYQRLQEMNVDGLQFELYTIGQSTRIAECPSFHVPIFTRDPKDRTIPEFKRLAADLVDGQGRLSDE